MNKQAVLNLFASYESATAEIAQIEAETASRIAEVSARQSALVAQIATEVGEGKKVQYNGKVLTPVLRTNADGSTKWFFRGLGDPKAPKNVVSL
jgi:hypothetical protein